MGLGCSDVSSRRRASGWGYERFHLPVGNYTVYELFFAEEVGSSGGGWQFTRGRWRWVPPACLVGVWRGSGVWGLQGFLTFSRFSIWIRLVIILCLFPCLWAVSRRLRNRRMHALHGNGPPSGADTSWRRAGKIPEAKLLQEQQPVRLLRALGWVIPPEVSDDSLLRVYDTRLEPSWTKSFVRELGPSGPTFVVGGDFMTSPHLADGHVVSQPRVTSWGPAGQVNAIVSCHPGRIRLSGWAGPISNCRWKHPAVRSRWLALCPRKAATQRWIFHASGVLCRRLHACWRIQIFRWK